MSIDFQTGILCISGCLIFFVFFTWCLQKLTRRRIKRLKWRGQIEYLRKHVAYVALENVTFNNEGGFTSNINIVEVLESYFQKTDPEHVTEHIKRINACEEWPPDIDSLIKVCYPRTDCQEVIDKFFRNNWSVTP